MRRIVAVELRPEVYFAAPARGHDRPKLQADAPVEHVGPLHEIVDPI